MALFVLGDTHLSLGGSKPMDVFPGWNGYVERLETNWRKLVKPEDTIVLAGDISWAMRLTDTRKDFEFLQQLPGQKLIMKGNHDYWWTTANKMNAYLKEIATLCNIPKNLTTHCARHTFATLAIEYGMPIDIIAKILGHTNTNMTRRYAKISEANISREMKKIGEMLSA